MKSAPLAALAIALAAALVSAPAAATELPALDLAPPAFVPEIGVAPPAPVANQIRTRFGDSGQITPDQFAPPLVGLETGASGREGAGSDRLEITVSSRLARFPI